MIPLFLVPLHEHDTWKDHRPKAHPIHKTTEDTICVEWQMPLDILWIGATFPCQVVVCDVCVCKACGGSEHLFFFSFVRIILPK